VPPEPISRLPVKDTDLDIVRQGMWLVVNGDNATARSAANDFISLAGKTGTAETMRNGQRVKIAWFICFGPFENPEYALAIMVDEGVSGGKTAAPLAKQFFENWLSE
jgi:cell division protein FtsI/penicillin-binding protein 2